MFDNAFTRCRALLSCAALAAVGFAAMTSPANAQTNLLTNGSFESGTFVDNGNGAQSLAVGATSITGWTVINNELAWLKNGNTYGLASSNGAFFLDLTGYHDSTPYSGVQQTIATTLGQQYILSFDVGVDQANGSYVGPNSVTATAGSASQTFTFSSTGAGNQYGRFSLNFTAAAATTTISLVGAVSGGGQYIGLDNAAVVAAVPEPGSVALLIGISISGAGFLARRRQARVR